MFLCHLTIHLLAKKLKPFSLYHKKKCNTRYATLHNYLPCKNILLMFYVRYLYQQMNKLSYCKKQEYNLSNNWLSISILVLIINEISEKLNEYYIHFILYCCKMNLCTVRFFTHVSWVLTRTVRYVLFTRLPNTHAILLGDYGLHCLKSNRAQLF